MQHAEIPNKLTTFKLSYPEKNILAILEPGDKVIYAIIRMHMNQSNRQCFPSISTIKKYAHCGQKKVEESIERLKNAKLITIGKIKLPNGKYSNLYTVTETKFEKPFERFTPEFLKSDIPLHLKEYLMDLQEFLFIHPEENNGDFSQSNFTLSNNTGWNVTDIMRFDKLLIEQGIETQELSGKTDESGLAIHKKKINLEAIQQASLWVNAVNNQLNETQKQVDEVNEDVDELKQRIKILEDRESLKEQQDLKKEQEIACLKKLLIANGFDLSTIKEEYNF